MELSKVAWSSLKVLERAGIRVEEESGLPVVPSVVAGTSVSGVELNPVRSPVDGSVIAYQALAEISPTSPAFEAIRGRGLSGPVDPELLEALEDEIVENQDTIVDVIVLDTGKTRIEARLEVDMAISLLRGGVGSASIPRAGGGRGAALSLPSYTMPFYTSVHSMVRASRERLPLVLKPPRKAPLATAVLAALATGIEGLRESVALVNVPGPQALGVARVLGMRTYAYMSPSKSAVSGVNGYQPGRSIAIVARGSIDDSLARTLVYSRSLHAGQACGSTGWIVVVGGRLTAGEREELVEAIESIEVSNPLSGAPQQGPLISGGLAEAAERYVALLEAMGGVLPTGFRREGLYVWPAIVESRVKDPSVLSRDPRFPILSIIAVESAAEAMSIAGMTSATEVLIAGLRSSEAATIAKNLADRRVYIEAFHNMFTPAPGAFTMDTCLYPDKMGPGTQVASNPLATSRRSFGAESYR